MDSSSTEYYQISHSRSLGDQSGRTLLLGYEAESGIPRVLYVGPPHGYGRGSYPSPPSQFISISPLEYNKAQHDRICNLVWPTFPKKNKRNKLNLWHAQLSTAETKRMSAAYEHQRTLHTLIQSNDWRLYSVRRTWNRARWVSMAWTYWKQDPKRLLDLTFTEFEITHPEDRGKHSRLEPMLTTRYIVKEYRSLGPSRPRHSEDSPVPVAEEIVGKDAIGEKIAAYFRARSSEVSPLVLFLHDVFWAKNCFPKGSFPDVEEGINSLLYDPPKRYDMNAQSAGESGWHQPSFNQSGDTNRSRDPRRPPPTSGQDRKARREEGKIYLLDLKPAVESVFKYRDSKWDLYSTAQKFGIQVTEEEKNPVHDSLLIVRLWTLVFSGSPRKILEEELESARKSASANPVSEDEPKDEDTKGSPPTRPDDEDRDPNDIPPVTSASSTFGRPQIAPEVDWENPFDEDEEDDY